MKKSLFLVPVIAAATMMMGCNDYLCLAPPGTTASSKLTICHGTGKPGKFNLITVKASAATAHVDHGDFLAPVGAKKDSDCKVPVVVPPVVVPPVVVPPVVLPPVVLPPVVVPPVVVTPPVIVVPPVVIDPTPGPSDGGGNTGGSDGEEEPAPGTGGDGGDAGEPIVIPPIVITDPALCIQFPTHVDCLL